MLRMVHTCPMIPPPKMYFTLSSIGTRRNVVEYLSVRYGLDISPSFSKAMFFMPQRSNGQHSSSSSSPPPSWCSNSIFRLRQVQSGTKVQQYFMFFTQAIGNHRRGSIVLLNRCIDAAYIITGITAPDSLFNDTLLECEMEAQRTMCISDVLIWQGTPLFESGTPARFSIPFYPDRHVILNEWLKHIRGTGCGIIQLEVPTWYKTLEETHSAYCNRYHDATHIVARSNRKTVSQKDAMSSLILIQQQQPSSQQHTHVDDTPHNTVNAYASPNSVAIASPNSVAIAPCNQDDDNNNEHTQNNECVGMIRDFYVHATDLPDVFELYSNKSMVGLLESPEAIACVRSMCDSKILRSNQGCFMKFEFVTQLQKWVPFRV